MKKVGGPVRRPTLVNVIIPAFLLRNRPNLCSVIIVLKLFKTVIHQHDVKLHAYADDSQLYMHCQRDDVAATATRLSQCVVSWTSATGWQLIVSR